MEFTHRSGLKSLVVLALCSLLVLSGALFSGESEEYEREHEGSSFESGRGRFENEREEEEERARERGRAGRYEGEEEEEEEGEFGEPQSGEGDNPDARSDWFTFQRTYPTDSIPADARHKALVAASKIKIESNIEPMAARGWQAIGPAPTSSFFPGNWGTTSGRINAVAVSPANPGIVLVGSSTGGIWRSTDGGASFAPVSDQQTDLAVGSLAFSKSNPSIVYAGMGDTKLGYLGSGVLKSTNEGRTWDRVSNNSLPSPGTIARVEVDPTNPNRVFVAQYSRLSEDKITSSGIYVSNNGGVSWSKKLGGAPRDIAIDLSNPQILYAGLTVLEKETDPAGGLYRSNDRGDTWIPVFNVDFEERRRNDLRVAIAPSDPRTIYAYYGGVISDSFQTQFRVSKDGGATWNDLGTSGFDTAQIGYNTYLVVAPNDANTIYLGSRDLFRSTDGGVSWTNLTQSYSFDGFGYTYTPFISKAHPDQHGFAFVPGSPNQFYLGNDGGIYKTTNGGQTFQSLNATLSLTQFTSIALHPTDPTITYGGTQDNGSQRRFVERGTWIEIATGDGGHVVINPTDPSTAFLTYIRGTIFRYRDNGRFFERQVAFDDYFGEPLGGSARIGFYAPLASNGIDSTLYFGTWRLFLSTDLGDTWFAPAGFLDLTKGITDKGADVLSAIAVSRTDTSVIYTGSFQGRAMVSADAGMTWNDITQGLPDRSITSIKTDPANASTAFITFSGFKTGHIFKTTDMGATWQDISGNLPDIPTNSLLLDPLNPKTLYAGTDVGVFRLISGSTSWQPFNNGLPPVIVQDFSAQADGLIQLATYGRGAYEVIGNQRPAITDVTWNGKKKLVITGRAFDDNARVLINNEDRTNLIGASSGTSITLKKKAKKLGLVDGDNTVQVINSDGVATSVFTLRI